MASNAQHTMTLTDFLLARIAEDEADAPSVHEVSRCTAMEWGGNTSNACDCGWPEGIKSECEAKRRIVDWAAPLVSGVRHENEDGRDLLCLLALPYADHPDCREEWRP